MTANLLMTPPYRIVVEGLSHGASGVHLTIPWPLHQVQRPDHFRARFRGVSAGHNGANSAGLSGTARSSFLEASPCPRSGLPVARGISQTVTADVGEVTGDHFMPPRDRFALAARTPSTRALTWSNCSGLRTGS